MFLYSHSISVGYSPDDDDEYIMMILVRSQSKQMLIVFTNLVLWVAVAKQNFQVGEKLIYLI